MAKTVKKKTTLGYVFKKGPIMQPDIRPKSAGTSLF